MGKKAKTDGPYGYGSCQWPPPGRTTEVAREAPPSIIAPIIAVIVILVVVAIEFYRMAYG